MPVMRMTAIHPSPSPVALTYRLDTNVRNGWEAVRQLPDENGVSCRLLTDMPSHMKTIMRSARIGALAWVAATSCLLGATVAFARSRRDCNLLPVTVRINPPATCEVSFAGQVFSLPDDEGRIVAAFRELRRDWRSVSVVGGVGTPYRCIGHAIFLAQRGGFKNVGFEAESPEH